MTGGGPPILQGNSIVGATNFYMLKLYNDAFGSNHAFGYAAAQATVLFIVIMIVTVITLKPRASGSTTRVTSSREGRGCEMAKTVIRCGWDGSAGRLRAARPISVTALYAFVLLHWEV